MWIRARILVRIWAFLIPVLSAVENKTVVTMAAKKITRQSNTDIERSKLISRSLMLKMDRMKTPRLFFNIYV